ncbi:hypothetical protein C0J52_25241 [Blattella germanica]|nr:hypothetical protein C0J52_25241 [Blattella germanica]
MRDCMDRSNVSSWCTFFQEGRVNLNDSPLPGGRQQQQPRRMSEALRRNSERPACATASLIAEVQDFLWCGVRYCS